MQYKIYFKSYACLKIIFGFIPLMNFEEEVIKRHLQICKTICDDKGYSKLSYQREEIKREVLETFKGNGYDLERVSQILDISDTTMFHCLDTQVMNRGSRPFGWPSYYEDTLRAEITKSVNSSHRLT